MIGKMIDRDQRDWDSALPYVMAAYRSSCNETTGFTPNSLMLGWEVRTPMDIVFVTQPEAPPRLYSDYADELEERLKTAYSDVRRHLGVAATRNKRRYDMRVKPEEFKVGEKVLYFSPRKYQAVSYTHLTLPTNREV